MYGRGWGEWGEGGLSVMNSTRDWSTGSALLCQGSRDIPLHLFPKCHVMLHCLHCTRLFYLNKILLLAFSWLILIISSMSVVAAAAVTKEVLLNDADFKNSDSPRTTTCYQVRVCMPVCMYMCVCVCVRTLPIWQIINGQSAEIDFKVILSLLTFSSGIIRHTFYS